MFEGESKRDCSSVDAAKGSRLEPRVEFDDWTDAATYLRNSPILAGIAMGNTFGTDILIQAKDPKKAAEFYVEELGFEITDRNPKMIGLHGPHINLFIEPGPPLGPVLEVTVRSVSEAKQRLTRRGCEIIKDEPSVPRTYIRDPNGMIYNLTE